MHDHIRDSLKRFNYSEQLKEAAVFRILFHGEDPSQVATHLGIHSTYTLTHWVKSFQRKIETGLITLPGMTTQQKQDLQALRQRNAELEQALQDANLMILALNTMIEVAEKELKLSIRKKSGRSGAPPKRS